MCMCVEHPVPEIEECLCQQQSEKVLRRFNSNEISIKLYDDNLLRPIHQELGLLTIIIPTDVWFVTEASAERASGSDISAQSLAKPLCTTEDS